MSTRPTASVDRPPRVLLASETTASGVLRGSALSPSLPTSGFGPSKGRAKTDPNPPPGGNPPGVSFVARVARVARLTFRPGYDYAPPDPKLALHNQSSFTIKVHDLQRVTDATFISQTGDFNARAIRKFKIDLYGFTTSPLGEQMCNEIGMFMAKKIADAERAQQVARVFAQAYIRNCTHSQEAHYAIVCTFDPGEDASATENVVQTTVENVVQTTVQTMLGGIRYAGTDAVVKLPRETTWRVERPVNYSHNGIGTWTLSITDNKPTQKAPAP